MNAKEYLSQAFWLDQRINSKLEQLESLRNLSMKVTTSYEQERVNKTKEKSPMENAIIKLLDLEREIDENIDELVDLKRKIMEIINSIESDEYRLVLEMRYLNFKTWEDISESLNYSYRQVHRIHGEALKMVKVS
jgi:DNA-directed RNA polymerase specialized sigma subunit